jgi:hypothetical protein
LSSLPQESVGVVSTLVLKQVTFGSIEKTG